MAKDPHFDELKQLNAELEKAKAELEKLSHFKSHLLSLASHQVRSSLAIIKGYTQMLRQGFHGPLNDEVAHIVGKIEFAAEDLINLVSNVIDLKKIEDGKITYDFKKLDIVLLAKQVIDYYKPLAGARGLEMTVSLPNESVFVKADEQHLKHVVQNLIDNAVKYTERGFIRISIEQRTGEAIFSVQDSGIGIKPGTSPLLFEEFIRDERVESMVKGSGLGLHIAKNIIEAHNGKIWAESEGEGQGATFTFSLSCER